MSTFDFIKHVNEVKQITGQYATPVIVNDRVDVMLATNASGVHLGKDDMGIADARKLCGKEYILGATAHNQAEINFAIEQGADYVGVGSMFSSPTKPSVDIAGIQLLEHVQGHNYLAIGGITTENVGELHDFGCNGIAVSSAIAQSTTPKSTVLELLQQKEQPA